MPLLKLSAVNNSKSDKTVAPTLTSFNCEVNRKTAHGDGSGDPYADAKFPCADRSVAVGSVAICAGVGCPAPDFLLFSVISRFLK